MARKFCVAMWHVLRGHVIDTLERLDSLETKLGKLAVAIWHVLSGHPIAALEPLHRLQTKLGKLATELGVPAIKALGFQSKTAFLEEKLHLLKSYP
ncbi:MAG: hypothetical protein H0W34_15295 [Pyrinomonadaceae bacterium]|nr:hypothetical protein [Pyrinomonadaceae bacterium]